jgi:hypothetical protein
MAQAHALMTLLWIQILTIVRARIVTNWQGKSVGIRWMARRQLPHVEIMITSAK